MFQDKIFKELLLSLFGVSVGRLAMAISSWPLNEIENNKRANERMTNRAGMVQKYRKYGKKKSRWPEPSAKQ